MSQVELGKTTPVAAAMDWFAERLGVDGLALEGENGAAVRAACEAAVARAEAEIEAHRVHRGGLRARCAPRGALRSGGDDRLALRLRLARGWALQHLGRMEEVAERAWGGSAGGGVDGRRSTRWRWRSTAAESCGTRWAASPPPRRCSTRRWPASESDPRAVRRAAGADLQHAGQDPPPPEGLHRRRRGRAAGARARSRPERRPRAGRDLPGRLAGRRASQRVHPAPASTPSIPRRCSSGWRITSTSASC